MKPLSRDRYAEGIGLFERALALDPRSVEVQSRLASALVGRVLDEMSAAGSADIARAEALIVQALVASPLSPLAHFARANFCALGVDATRPLPNTRRRSHQIAIRRAR